MGVVRCWSRCGTACRVPLLADGPGSFWEISETRARPRVFAERFWLQRAREVRLSDRLRDGVSTEKIGQGFCPVVCSGKLPQKTTWTVVKCRGALAPLRPVLAAHPRSFAPLGDVYLCIQHLVSLEGFGRVSEGRRESWRVSLSQSVHFTPKLMEES